MPDASAGRTLLIVSQVYIPDPASVGQHMHDAAAELVRRGYRVIVYASARGYDDPSCKYPRREVIDGVEVRRLPLSSFGKKSIAIRMLGGALFVAQAMGRGVLVGNLAGVLVSTSPPFAPIAGGFIRLFRRAPMVYWAMDLNPDQMIALGKIKAGSLPARVFEAINRFTLRRAGAVIALDRFMARRLERKSPVGERMHTIPPWPHQQHLQPLAHADNPFRTQQKLAGKFVVMYSGNISLAHPVTTILDAAGQLQDDDDLVFLFIGGGVGKQRIEAYAAQHGLTNVRTLAYQPIEKIRYSLSAADVHLVCMGESMVGIVHPCKAYGAMAVARPILLLGPAQSHLGEMIQRYDVGWAVDHGQVDQAVALLRQIRRMPQQELAAMGQRAHQAIRESFNEAALTAQFGEVVDAALGHPTASGRVAPTPPR